MFKNLIKKIKRTAGNSLVEFAVTVGMMATLATVAAPKFGGIGEAAKEKKTVNNMDKIITAANNFYMKTTEDEGRGRFPGQSKYDEQVGGFDLIEGETTPQALEIFLESILPALTSTEAALGTYFVYCFAGSATDEDALQITYAYNNTNLSEDKYYILDTPLYIKQPTNGFIINKSNNVVGMGESDVLYPDEVWSDPGFLPSPNLRSQDYFIKLYNHTVTPKAYRPEDDQGEIVNFCRLNKLSPKSRVYLNKAGEAIAIEAERGGLAVDNVGEGAWPDVEPYKYGITLYGNKLNSSKKLYRGCIWMLMLSPIIKPVQKQP